MCVHYYSELFTGHIRTLRIQMFLERLRGPSATYFLVLLFSLVEPNKISGLMAGRSD